MARNAHGQGGRRLVVIPPGHRRVCVIPAARPRVAPPPGAEKQAEAQTPGVSAPAGGQLAAPQPNVRGRIPGMFYSRRYKLVSLLGQGARAAVYRAQDRVLNIEVAIKFLPMGVALNREAVEQIKHEAALAMRLSHENIVRLHNVEIESGRMFLVMEYVAGRNLRQVLQEVGRLSLRSVLSIAESAAVALDYAHQRGVLHRDLKPENLMISEEGVLKIVDFGTAMLLRSRTARDYIEGTPGYMSPEELQYEPLDRRADVFSFGVVLAELLTGRVPFAFTGDLQQLVAAEPAPMPEVPAPVADVLRKAMAKQRSARWATAGEFYAALTQAAAEAGPPEPP